MNRLKRIAICSVWFGCFMFTSCANVSMYSSQNQQYPQDYKNKEEREIARMRQELYHSYDNFLYKAQSIMSQGPKNVK